MLQGTPYADRNPIGLCSVIEGATSAQLRAFYEKWYTAENVTVIGVGDFGGNPMPFIQSFSSAVSQAVNRSIR